MSELSEFAEGRPCDLHDIPFCADCAARLRLRRGVAVAGESASDWRYQEDCSVATVSEIFGVTYDEAREILGPAFRPGQGTLGIDLKARLAEAGWTVTVRGSGRVTARGTRYDGMTREEARAASARGRVFILIGKDRYGAHAWSAVGGRINRPLTGPQIYGILEVTA